MKTPNIYEPSDEDVEDFIKSLTKYNDVVINGSIEVVGGIDEAISILKNAPQDSNCYDIMYERYGYLESFLWVDHNITVKLSDLKQAVGKIKYEIQMRTYNRDNTQNVKQARKQSKELRKLKMGKNTITFIETDEVLKGQQHSKQQSCYYEDDYDAYEGEC